MKPRRRGRETSHGPREGPRARDPGRWGGDGSWRGRGPGRPRDPTTGARPVSTSPPPRSDVPDTDLRRRGPGPGRRALPGVPPSLRRFTNHPRAPPAAPAPPPSSPSRAESAAPRRARYDSYKPYSCPYFTCGPGLSEASPPRSHCSTPDGGPRPPPRTAAATAVPLSPAWPRRRSGNPAPESRRPASERGCPLAPSAPSAGGRGPRPRPETGLGPAPPRPACPRRAEPSGTRARFLRPSDPKKVPRPRLRPQRALRGWHGVKGIRPCAFAPTDATHEGLSAFRRSHPISSTERPLRLTTRARATCGRGPV